MQVLMNWDVGDDKEQQAILNQHGWNNPGNRNRSFIVTIPDPASEHSAEVFSQACKVVARQLGLSEFAGFGTVALPGGPTWDIQFVFSSNSLKQSLS